MRIAVISDIHGNLEAFRHVLADIDRSDIQTIINLGDIIGYGPDPEEAVKLLRRRQIVSVLGNHELALISRAYCNRLNESTRRSLAITRKMLSAESLEFLCSLDNMLIYQGGRFVHGCPPASTTVYLFNPSERLLVKLFGSYREKICFVGHTHILAMFAANGDAIRTENLTRGLYKLSPQERYILSVGSVGQPRDSQNNNSKYIIWDDVQETVEVRFVPYDASATVDKIRQYGFPEQNATRLL